MERAGRLSDTSKDQSMLDLIRTETPAWFAIEEVAQAAGVATEEVWRLVGLGQAVVSPGQWVSTADAVHLVRVLRGEISATAERAPFNKIPSTARKTARGFATAGAIHVAAALLLMIGPW